MPLLFSYGSLQDEDVQLKTFGRLLTGHRDELPQYEKSSVQIEDEVAANVTFNGNAESRVPGVVFEITDDELANVDKYEAEYFYERTVVTLASGQQAWVYLLSKTHKEL